ncbi:MAG: alpha/beta hydrolase [Ardenticatenia bacterium]|nr:alpha/beta hydrolase [Ardenticatenia bacterium]
MPFVTVGHMPIFYRRRGTAGPRVIFVHGAGGSSRHWSTQVHDVGQVAQCVALDLPGHGRSGGTGATTIADYSALVVAFIEALGWPSATIVGHSMGGAVALWTALHYPARVERLGLVGTGAKLRVHPDILRGLAALDPAPALRLIARWAYRPTAPEELIEAGVADLKATPASVTHGDFLACDRFDVRDQVGRIPLPVLVLTGTEDTLTPPRYAEYMAERLPHAQLRLIPDAGHFVMLEQPQAVSRALVEFLHTSSAEVGRAVRPG